MSSPSRHPLCVSVDLKRRPVSPLLIVGLLAVVYLAPVELSSAMALPEHRPARLAGVPDQVTVRGVAVDAETGEPIPVLITQAGRFDLDDPTDVTWGFTEGRSSREDGSFSVSIRWDEGWTARVLADGYLPHPVVSEAPPAGRDVIEVTLRMKRGRVIKGAVLDAAGAPVAGAGVFAVGPTGVTLEQGQAMLSYGRSEIDTSALRIETDEDGRFEIPVGEVRGLAVSMEGLDAWPAALPAEGDELVVRLPAPAAVRLEFDIPGAEEEQEFFFQLLAHEIEEFRGVSVERRVVVKNGGELELTGLTPGEYQFARSRMLRTPDMGLGRFLDRTYVTIEPGETKTLDFTRPEGLRVEGIIDGLESAGLDRALVYVYEAPEEGVEVDDHDFWDLKCLDGLVTDATGAFLTEQLPPGRYLVVAEGYPPLTPAERVRSGRVQAAFTAQLELEIPESNMVDTIRLELEPRKDR